MSRQAIGARLRAERVRLGLSQTEFGIAGGVLKGAQIKYEKGDRQPDSDYLAGIAQKGANVGHIINGAAPTNVGVASGIGERIKKSRGAFTQEAFAARIGVSRRTINEWERKSGIPNGAHLLDMHREFGIDPTFILVGEKARAAAERRCTVFDRVVLRLKHALLITLDQEVAALLDMTAAAFSARKVRDAFPADKLWALAARRPDLGLDVAAILAAPTGGAA